MIKFFRQMFRKKQVPFLKITFGGLCSFVEEKQGEDSKIHVLLPAAEKCPVDPALCAHHRFLIFSARHLLEASGEFYDTFVGFDPRGRPATLCRWDLDGKDVTITSDLQGKNKAANARYKKGLLLDLDLFEGGGVARKWIECPVKDLDLIGTRILLDQGLVRGGRGVRERWKMCLEKDSTKCSPVTGEGAWTFSQTVDYSIFDAALSVAIKAKDGQQEQSIKLGFPKGRRRREYAFGTIANVCPPPTLHTPIQKERDVLAYYELCSTPKPQSKRLIPWKKTAHVSPRESACPPVNQSIK